MSDWGGPYVMMVVICRAMDGTPMEAVVTDHGTTYNLRGIANRAVIGSLGETVSTDLFIGLIPGTVSGVAELTINLVEPDGVRSPPGSLKVPFDKEPSSPTAVKFRINLTVSQPGTHWIELRMGDRLLSKTPLQVDLMPGIPEAFITAWDE